MVGEEGIEPSIPFGQRILRSLVAHKPQQRGIRKDNNSKGIQRSQISPRSLVYPCFWPKNVPTVCQKRCRQRSRCYWCEIVLHVACRSSTNPLVSKGLSITDVNISIRRSYLRASVPKSVPRIRQEVRTERDFRYNHRPPSVPLASVAGGGLFFTRHVDVSSLRGRLRLLCWLNMTQACNSSGGETGCRTRRDRRSFGRKYDRTCTVHCAGRAR